MGNSRMSVFSEQRANPRQLKIKERIETPESGGYFTYHVSFPYPEKGLKNIYIVIANNMAKRALIGWIRFFGLKTLAPLYLVFLFYPYKLKIKVIEKWLTEFYSTAESYLETYNDIKQSYPAFLELRYYGPLTRELKKGIEEFLVRLGISAHCADRFAFYFVTLIEYDSAYYYRIEDLFTETSAEKLKNSRREIKHLVNLLIQREKHAQIIPKFKGMGLLLTWLFLSPKIKRAFKKALEVMEFEKLQFDDADRYHVRQMKGYDYFGMTFEERLKKWPLEQHTIIDLDWSKVTDEQLAQLLT